MATANVPLAESCHTHRVNSVTGAPRILHVTPFFAPAWSYGGLVESAFQFSRGLAREGVAIRVLTTDANGTHRKLDSAEREKYSRAPGFEVRYCARIARQSVSLEMLRALAEHVRWADVVHLHAAFSFPTIPALIAARILDRPVVWTPHGALQRWAGSRRTGLKSLWEHVCRIVAPRDLVMHLTSQAEIDECRVRFPGARVALVPNGVEVPTSIDRKPAGAVLRLGFLGRLDPKKGIENLLQACSLVKQRGAIDFRLEIAGAGAADYEPKIKLLIDRLGLTAEVTLLGDLRDQEKFRMLERTDIALVPSFTENFAIVVAEALAHGAAVIASTGTPWREIESKGCGLWVNNDPASLASAIERMGKMPVAEMGMRGRRWMAERFTWPICAAEMLALYTEILARRSRASTALVTQT